jgi:hypothetical protein
MCPDFTLITPETVGRHLDGSGLKIEWKKLKLLAHKADCLRVAIINKYGGLWIDCDTVMIRPVSVFEDVVNDNYGKKFLYMRWNDGRCLNGYFYGEKGNSITAEWLEKINANITTMSSTNRQWAQLGEMMLGPIINSNKHHSECLEIDRRIFLPINFDKIPQVFFEPVHYSSFIIDNTVAVGLNHSYFFKFFQPEVIQNTEPWKGNNLINILFNDAR